MSMVDVQPTAPSGMTMAPPPRKRIIPGWATFALGIVAVVGVLATTSYLTGEPALTSSSTMQNTVTLGLPILLCGLGGIWAERSGMINIGLEGMMILGTWGAAWAGVLGLGPYGSVLFGAVFGALGGLLHAIATVSFGVNHIVSGVAINLLGAGVAKYLSTLIFAPLSDNPRDSPPIERFDTFSAPGLGDWLGELESEQRAVISDVAGLLRGLVTRVSPMLIIGILLVFVTYLVLWHTRFGLRLRSCGENPVAAESLGVNVYLHKYVAVVASGALAGIGGAALVLGSSPSIYSEGQTANRGFIGLAAMIFGNWRPGGTLAGAGLFGYADGLRLSSGPETVHSLLYAAVICAGLLVIWQLFRRKWTTAALAAVGAVAVYVLYYATDELPTQFLPYTPHIITLVVLALAAQRLRPPAADGMPYRRGEGD
ncbi:ABC transporter permease [Actinophytocola algeriensis]|uniref:Simple sugar transport system permease protein n=1 Tax=Actinophytocola algeriensis TaxID=1768010 RepID=A0A7W7VBB6_9PSEU|nr:simple sugar transport system permease protein [Actinophytocola algeriensis]MBE1477321.1 simple sugar transport system permease protein [Actinophytocola algeriensis]